MFDKLKQLGKESLIYGLSRVVGRFVSAFLVPVYTRIFIPSDYGVVDMVTTYASITTIFIVLGLDTATIIYFYGTDDIKDKKNILSTSFFSQLAMSFIMLIPPLFFSSNVSELVLDDRNYSVYFRLVALDFPFIFCIGFAQDVLRLIRKPWKYLIITLGAILSNIILTILLVVVFKKGLYGVFLSKLVVDIIFAIISIYLFRSLIVARISLYRLKQLLACGIPLIPASISYWVLDVSNRYFLRYYISLSEVGIYSIGSKMASLLMLFTGAFQLAWSPFSLSIQHEEDSKRVYANVLTYYLVIMCGMGVGLSIFSLEILKIFTTKLYYGASIIVPYLVFSVMSSGVYYIISIGVNITKKTSHIGWTTMVSAGASIALNFILIPRYGIVGASIASCISTWLSPILLYFVSQHYYPINYKLGKVAIILSSSIILIIIGNFVKIPNLLLAIALKFALFAAYFLILMASSIIQPSMLLRLLKGLGKQKGLPG